MNRSIERVRALLNGDSPDRPPLFDLLRNDAVLSHFAGEQLTLENAERVVFGAFESIVDATRPAVRMPHKEETITLEDGRNQRHFRWTAWTEPVRYASDEAYVAAKRELLAADPAAWGPVQEDQMRDYLDGVAEYRRKLGEVFFVASGRTPRLMSLITESGLDQFAYRNADHPELIDELLEHETIRSVTFVEHLPEQHGIELVMLGEDCAYKTAPMLAPGWFDERYHHRLARIVSAYHAKGIKVMFHSDGNLNEILDGLVGAGIDALNPLEVLAGMDIRDLHARYPDLIFVGGIDVSQLLPLGTPEEVKNAVRRAIEDSDGQIMVGSSTELHHGVPLENYLALREAVLTWS